MPLIFIFFIVWLHFSLSNFGHFRPTCEEKYKAKWKECLWTSPSWLPLCVYCLNHQWCQLLGICYVLNILVILPFLLHWQSCPWFLETKDFSLQSKSLSEKDQDKIYLNPCYFPKWTLSLPQIILSSPKLITHVCIAVFVLKVLIYIHPSVSMGVSSRTPIDTSLRTRRCLLWNGIISAYNL